VGIAEAYHKIFKVFTKLDSNNKSSGIGLSIVKKIIDFIKEEFGWRVRKKGTTFYFTIPKTNGGS
jgi:signal transduction histidine kinase